jgi:hypothetical protein
MDVAKLLTEIDAEIERLQQARATIAGLNLGSSSVVAKPKRGRPKGSTNAPKAAKRKRNLSPEGRKRIAEAMKRRWAERRKETPAKK